MIKISYVIPAYNAEETIGKCITAIKKQKFSKEIIVINDGSKDKTKELCLNEKVKCITIPNSGVAVARNLGLKLATGDYIALIDSDTYLDNDWSEKVMKNDFKKWDFIITPSRYPKEAYLETVKRFKNNTKITLKNLVIFSNGIIFKSKNKKFVVFDENFIVGGEDWEIVLRLIKNGFKIKLDSSPTYEHRHIFKTQRKRILTFLKKKFLFSYGDLYCYLKHRDVNEVKHFLKQNLWIIPFFPFIKLSVSIKRMKNKKNINKLSLEGN